MKFFTVFATALVASVTADDAVRFNELVVMEGHTKKDDFNSPLPHE